MKTKVVFSSLLLLFLAITVVKAQPVFYQHDTSIKVIAYGHEQNLAWCGGFNCSQFTMGDLNHDGLQDLVIFDDWIGLRTFINVGSAGNPNFVYAPEYALNFPPLYAFCTLADYNCDGIPDLFHRGNTGYEVYKGYYNSSNQLCFTFKQDLYYDNFTWGGGPVNAYVNPGDIPSVVDVDGDGDLDFVSYDVYGRTLYYYRNMRVELGLPCDSLVIHLEDMCWGKVLQQFWQTHIMPYECSEAGLILPRHEKLVGKTTHSGNTPCLFDWDMDGDMDYLDGSISFSHMTFLKNGRVDLGLNVDSMVYQDTTWQSTTGGKIIDLTLWPAAFNVDVDQDGKKDLLIAPNSQGASENYKCVWYYKNETTPGSPNWIFQSDSFLVDHSIDLGTGAYPMLFDFNRDGKLDLFVGSDGYYQPSGLLQSRISYYENTSTPGNPSLTLRTTDFLNIDSYAFQGAAPAFGDIDNDGKPDMLIGHKDGTITYFKNMAASSSVQPVWQLIQLTLTDMTGSAINVGGNATPFIYDVDRDGKPDLVIGSQYGAFQYYQNVTTVPGLISLKLINTNLGNVRADPNSAFPNYSTPFVGKVDSTGVDYLMTGSNSGNIYRFGGIATGDTSMTYTMLDSSYSFIDSQYLYYNNAGTVFGVYQGLRTSLTVGDIVGDGGLEMIVGNVRGGVELYKLKTYYPALAQDLVKNETGSITISPNPVNEKLTVNWSSILSEKLQLSIFNMSGQQLYNSGYPTSRGNAEIEVANLPNGMYVCVLQSDAKKYYSKFAIVR